MHRYDTFASHRYLLSIDLVSVLSVHLIVFSLFVIAQANVFTVGAVSGNDSYNDFNDDVIKRKHFHVTGPLCGEFTGHRWIPLKCQWHEALMFSLICAWTNSWVHNREAGDLRHRRAHYDVTVMYWQRSITCIWVASVRDGRVIVYDKSRDDPVQVIWFAWYLRWAGSPVLWDSAWRIYYIPSLGLTIEVEILIYN